MTDASILALSDWAKTRSTDNVEKSEELSSKPIPDNVRAAMLDTYALGRIRGRQEMLLELMTEIAKLVDTEEEEVNKVKQN